MVKAPGAVQRGRSGDHAIPLSPMLHRIGLIFVWADHQLISGQRSRILSSAIRQTGFIVTCAAQISTAFPTFSISFEPSIAFSSLITPGQPLGSDRSSHLASLLVTS